MLNKKLFRIMAFITGVLLIFCFTACIIEADSEEGNGDPNNNPTLYTVTFNINGGSGTTPTAEKVTYGTYLHLPYSGFYKTGYTFGGWNTRADGTGSDAVVDGLLMYFVTEDITLYAMWNEIVIYTVTFYTSDATSGTAPEAQTAAAGSSIILPSKGDLERDGYTFGGWRIFVGNTETKYDAGSSFTVTEDVTMYVNWVWIPTVSGTYSRNNTVIGGVSYSITFRSDGTCTYTETASGMGSQQTHGTYSVSGTNVYTTVGLSFTIESPSVIKSGIYLWSK